MIRYKKQEVNVLNNQFYDINEVCTMLGTTSRTLRFYEEKKIIESTKLKNSNRRQYTQEQIQHIQNVMVLRILGLSIKAISELQQQNNDLKQTFVFLFDSLSTIGGNLNTISNKEIISDFTTALNFLKEQNIN